MVALQNQDIGVRTRPAGKSAKRGFLVAMLSLIFIAGLVLSFAFPFGVGVMLFLWLFVLAGAVGAVGVSCVKLFKSLLTPSVSFQYTPTASYLAGKKRGVRKQEGENDESRMGEEEEEREDNPWEQRPRH